MINKFNEFEKKYSLFDLQIDDFDIWPYIRFDLYFKIGESIGTLQQGSELSQKVLINDFKNIFINTFINNPWFSCNRHDVLIIAHQRRVKENGKFRCLYTEELSATLPYDCITAEYLFGKKHYKPVKNNNVMYLDYIDVIPWVIFKLYISGEIAFEKIANIIYGNIEEYFGVQLNKDYIKSLVKKQYCYHKHKKYLLKQLLLKISPKVILDTVGYATNQMVLHEVAREMGIPCIELQHGYMGRGHIAYNYSIDRELRQFPSHLFVFSNYWKNACSFPIATERIIATGFPYMEEQVNKWVKKEGDGEAVRIIVYSSAESFSQLKAFTEDLVKKMKEEKDSFHIIYKLHPLEYGMDSNDLEELKKLDSVEVINSPQKSLYELCATVDFQIGVKSTAIFEGLAYGLGTFILDTGDSDIDLYTGDLVRLGYASMGKRAEDFIQYIKTGHDSKKSEKECREMFFKGNALQNISDEVSKIILNWT